MRLATAAHTVKKRFALCYLTVVCPVLSVCLSVCNVGVLWPNGWMDQDETSHAGRPRTWPHCVGWRPSRSSPKGQSPPTFSPYQLWPNAWMDQDATWYGGMPRPRRLCVRWGPSSPPQKGGGAPSPKFSAHVHCGKTAGWIKMALGMEVGLGPGHIVLDGVPAQKEGEASNFRPTSINVAKQLHG